MTACLAVVQVSAETLTPDSFDSTAIEASIDFQQDMAQEVSQDPQSCSCNTLRCNSKVQANSCSVSCDAPRKALCQCGKCEYGAFNACRCVG